MSGGQTQFCAEHMPEGMVPLTGYRCQRDGCAKRASYGQRGGRPQFCIVVAAGAVSNSGGSGEGRKPAHLCLHQGCTKRASYGKKGEKPQFCAEHAPGGTEDVRQMKCEHAGCKKAPSYGVPGGRR